LIITRGIADEEQRQHGAAIASLPACVRLTARMHAVNIPIYCPRKCREQRMLQQVITRAMLYAEPKQHTRDQLSPAEKRAMSANDPRDVDLMLLQVRLMASGACLTGLCFAR